MNQINEEVIKARAVVAGYKKYNQNTVEKCESYNPKTKCRYFKKVSIDPRSAEFKKEFGKKEKKEISRNTKTVKSNSNTQKFKKIKKLEKIQKVKTNSDFDQNTIISKVYNLHLQNKNTAEIAKLTNLTKREVSSKIRARQIQLGIPCQHVSDNYNKTVELIKKGKSLTEISKILNITAHTISVHSMKYNKLKSCSEKEKENKEILDLIKAKAKLNGVDYCYGSWIGRKHNKLKSNLTSVEIVKRCNEMIESGILEEVKEMYSRKNGRMYKLKESVNL